MVLVAFFIFQRYSRFCRFGPFSTLLIFLFFRKDFLHSYELPHDVFCTSRSDDNRRAAGAVGFFSI